MIAKLQNGNIRPCPLHGHDGSGRMHTDLPLYYEHNPDVAADDGYYPVQYTDKPEGDYRSAWQLVDGRITQVWTAYTPEPEPLPAPDPYQMRADIDYIAMMTGNDL